jgi:hypothetical protein
MIFKLSLLNVDMGNIFYMCFLETGKVACGYFCLIFYLGI